MHFHSALGVWDAFTFDRGYVCCSESSPKNKKKRHHTVPVTRPPPAFPPSNSGQRVGSFFPINDASSVYPHTGPGTEDTDIQGKS